MKKYLVETTRRMAMEDVDYDYYDTLDEANAAAKAMWEHFTSSEQKNNAVAVGWVTPEMVDESLHYDDDDEWWTICGEWDADNSCLSFGG